MMFNKRIGHVTHCAIIMALHNSSEILPSSVVGELGAGVVLCSLIFSGFSAGSAALCGLGLDCLRSVSSLWVSVVIWTL